MIGRRRRQWLAGAAVTLALVAGVSGVALAGSGTNPAQRDPGFPGRPGTPFRHPPDEIGPCGYRWKDLYVDENGVANFTIGDNYAADDPHGGCRPLTKAEVERQRQAQDQPQAPAGRVVQG
jgi:hypothetical protein